MSVQGVIYVICILIAAAGVLVAGAHREWVAALAFAAFAAFVLAFAWPVLSA